MKNIQYFLLLSYMVLLLITNVGCSDDTTVNNGNNGYIDPTILHTDSFGIILGGDTSDWCYRGNNEFYFNPPYPNPTNDRFKFNFGITIPDTISLFYINITSDTTFVLRNQYMGVGQYELEISSNFHNLNYITKRFYIKPKNNYNNSPSCKYYGDIQFY